MGRVYCEKCQLDLYPYPYSIVYRLIFYGYVLCEINDSNIIRMTKSSFQLVTSVFV
jgi:hypothetical protein